MQQRKIRLRAAHNPEVVGSSPASATIKTTYFDGNRWFFYTKKFGLFLAVLILTPN